MTHSKSIARMGIRQFRSPKIFVADNAGDWHLHCHLPHHMMNQMASMVGPLMTSQANSVRPGAMNAGLGAHEGHALSDAAAPALGRDVNIGATPERAVSNTPGPDVSPSLRPLDSAPNAGMYPGYPQDMFMTMDALVEKPETFGLKPGWSGGTMGMMTIVRVLTPELFDTIQTLKAAAGRQP